jgi:AcrR family transcriptional regulator
VPSAPRPGPRKLPQQERSRALYEAILIACAELLEREGPDFTLAQVATRAGVAAGSFYQFFPDRRALVGALIDRQIAADRAELEALRAVPDVSPEALPELLVSGVLRLYGARPKAMASMVALLHELDRASDVQALSDEFCAVVSTHLQRHQPARSPADCLAAARAAIHALLGIVRQAVTDDPTKLTSDPTLRRRLQAIAQAALST